MLKVSNIEVTYSAVILVLKGVSFEVPTRKIIALLGANGAGKSTTLKAISGLLSTELGKVSSGTIEWDGRRIENGNPEEICKLGIVQVIEGRKVLEHLTVEENIMVVASTRRDGQVRNDWDMIYYYFPRLKELRHAMSGYISGGEKQMLVIARAMMARPKLMLLDEPSVGLSPLLAKEVFKIVQQFNSDVGSAILLVEQNARMALSVASYAYVMENGRVALDGPAEKVVNNPDIREFYLGLDEIGERKSYREVKHYKRRIRWLG